jgi:Sulfotransferase family
MTPPPLFVLGVRRSGTTLLRVILDRSESIAIPDESHFVPQLAHRHRGPLSADRFADDLRRVPTLGRWGISVEDVLPRLHDGMTTGEAIGAVFAAYAAAHGKLRWGDKTPAYMRHLGLLDALFPEASYVHLIRDGRDCALSFLRLPDEAATRTWAHPEDAAGFARQWVTEIRAARELGARVGPARYLEARYEQLADEPAEVVRVVCDFASLRYAPTMLEPGAVALAEKPHHRRLVEPPSRQRDWRREMSESEVRAFEAVSGSALANLGYELSDPSHARAGTRARLGLGWYRARIGAWKAAAYASQRSPLWRRRHPPVPRVSATARRSGRGTR